MMTFVSRVQVLNVMIFFCKNFYNKNKPILYFFLINYADSMKTCVINSILKIYCLEVELIMNLRFELQEEKNTKKQRSLEVFLVKRVVRDTHRLVDIILHRTFIKLHLLDVFSSITCLWSSRQCVGLLDKKPARVRAPGPDIKTKYEKYFFGDFLSADF